MHFARSHDIMLSAVGPEPPLTDPLSVADVFATGACLPEFEGGHVRVTCYADRNAPIPERVVVARIVFSADDFRAALAKVAAAAASEIGGGAH